MKKLLLFLVLALGCASSTVAMKRPNQDAVEDASPAKKHKLTESLALGCASSTFAKKRPNLGPSEGELPAKKYKQAVSDEEQAPEDAGFFADDEYDQLAQSMNALTVHEPTSFEDCPYRCVVSIVKLLDYQSFTTFALLCKKAYELCENIDGQNRIDIVYQAAAHGNKRLACRFLKIPLDETKFVVYSNILKFSFVLPSGKTAMTCLPHSSVTNDDCKSFLQQQIIDLLRRNRCAEYIKALFDVYIKSWSLDKEFASTIVSACVQFKRLDLYEWCLSDTKICDYVPAWRWNAFRALKFPGEYGIKEEVSNDLS